MLGSGEVIFILGVFRSEQTEVPPSVRDGLPNEVVLGFALSWA